MNTAGFAWAPEQVPGPKNMHIKDAAKVCFHRLENVEQHTPLQWDCQRPVFNSVRKMIVNERTLKEGENSKLYTLCAHFMLSI